MRLAMAGSAPIVTLTAMPGFRSATVAFCPRKVTSVKGVILYDLDTLSASTVTESAATLAITVSWCSMAFDFFFFSPARRGLAERIAAATQTLNPKDDFMRFILQRRPARIETVFPDLPRTNFAITVNFLGWRRFLLRRGGGQVGIDLGGFSRMNLMIITVGFRQLGLAHEQSVEAFPLA